MFRIREEIDVLSLFGIFNRTKRKIIPLSYYSDDEKKAENTEETVDTPVFANPDDFPEEFFEKTIIMTKRLHEMGVYEEKEIVRFIIPKILDFLELAGVLSGVSISGFDTAGVVFGENYAGWLYKGKTKKGNELLYRVPYQLIFYHSKKEENYFICKTKDGLELRQNKVSVTNSENKEHIIKNTKSIKLTEEGLKELKVSYSVLFMYIKIQILRKMDQLGYLEFADKIAKYFCDLTTKDEFISCVRQYFALSIEKEENILVYENHSFKDFLFELLTRNHYSVDFSDSYVSIMKWVEEKTDIKPDIQREYHDHMEFIKEVSVILANKGYYLYFLIKEDVFQKTALLLGEQKGIFENNLNFSYEITAFSEDLINRYMEDVSNERKVRELAKSFYQVIEVADIQAMMMQITGSRVLDYALLKNDYLSAVYSDEDMDIYDMFGELLSRYNMPDLIKHATDVELTLDSLYFLEVESVNPVDRAILYADAIRRNKKLLYSFEAGGYFYLGIIEDTGETKERFITCVSHLLEMKEIENYVIYDSKEKELFVNLLFGMYITIDGNHVCTKEEIKERFYKENAEHISKEEANRYLSRIAIKKSEVNICVSNYYEEEDELEFTVKAENGEYFTNQDLLFQIQRYLVEKIEFEKMSGNKIDILGLRLSVDRDKYYLFWDEV